MNSIKKCNGPINSTKLGIMDTFNFFDAWNECNKIEIVFLDKIL